MVKNVWVPIMCQKFLGHFYIFTIFVCSENCIQLLSCLFLSHLRFSFFFKSRERVSLCRLTSFIPLCGHGAPQEREPDGLCLLSVLTTLSSSVSYTWHCGALFTMLKSSMVAQMLDTGLIQSPVVFLFFSLSLLG